MSVASPNPCPECGGAVLLPASLEVGEIVQCSECGVDLEVIGLGPVELQVAPEEEEDWGE